MDKRGNDSNQSDGEGGAEEAQTIVPDANRDEFFFIQVGAEDGQLSQVQAGSNKRYEIGPFSLREPDYRAVLKWSKLYFDCEPLEFLVSQALDSPKAIPVGPYGSSDEFDWDEQESEFNVIDGSITGLTWHMGPPLPLPNDWEAGLIMRDLCMVSDYRFPGDFARFWMVRELIEDMNKRVVMDVCMASLRRLVVSGFDMQELNLNACLDLEILSCPDNELESIDLQRIPKLKALNCSDNKIKELSLKETPELLRLKISNNRGIKLRNASCLNLEVLECENSGFGDGETDLRCYPKLKCLNIASNGFDSICLASVSELEKLDCNTNELESLDLSHVPNLRELDCSDNEIEQLDLSCVPELRILNCEYLCLKRFDFSPIAKIERLNCSRQLSLTEGPFDLTGLEHLRELNCRESNITWLILPKSGKLTVLHCVGNSLSELDLSAHRELSVLDCTGNRLESLNLAGLPQLEELACGNNPLKQLDLSALHRLRVLACNGLGLTRLDLRHVPRLESLFCSENEIVSLDLSPAGKLRELDCSSSPLVKLILGFAENLKKLNCLDTDIEEIDLASAPNMRVIACDKDVRIHNAPKALIRVDSVKELSDALWVVPEAPWFEAV